MVNILQKAINIGKHLEAKQNKIHNETAPKNDITENADGSLNIKAMEADDVADLNLALKAEGYKGKGLNIKRLVMLFKEENGNTVLDVDSMLANIKENNKELFAYLRRPKQTMKAMVILAEKKGFTKLAHQFLKRKPGDIAPAEDLIGGLIAMIKIKSDLKKKADAILKTVDEGEKLQLFRELQIGATLLKNLSAQVSGNVSESARNMAVISNIGKLKNIDVSGFSDQINKISDNMDENMIDFHATAILNLKDEGQVHYLADGVFKQSMDISMEIYINALLSSPVTHMVNVAGNSLFQATSSLETGMAGLIGEVRTLGNRRGKIGDRVFLGEMTAEAHGATMALKDALTSMSLSLSITGQAGDFASKIDLKNKRAIGSTDNLIHIAEMAQQGDVTAMLVNMLGVVTRLPGRFLASEDQFFKVISKRKVLYREAYREQLIIYETALKGGVDKVKAREMAQKRYEEIMIEPPEDIIKKMDAEALIMTFQGDPKGAWASLVNASNKEVLGLPIMKIIIPFSKTPTNIVKEVFDRTMNYSPIYKALKQNIPNNKQGIDQSGSKQSGEEFDRAMSKLVLGNGLFMGMVMVANGDYGDNIIVTGSGPSDWKARRYMRANNIPPYSIGFKKDNGEYRFITFSRLDPISGIMAMASDYAYYSKNEEDQSVLIKLAKAGSLAVAEYAMELPFLKGVSDIVKMAGNPYGSKDDLFTRATKSFGKLGGQVAMTLTSEANTYLPESMELPGASSWTRTVERMGNPDANNTMLSAEQIDDANEFILPDLYKGFYKALNEAKAGNALYSSTLEKGLDFWGNIKKQSNGKPYEWFSPIKIEDSSYSKLDLELLRLSERGYVFQSHRKKYNGVELSAKQFNNYVTLVNNSHKSGKYSLSNGDSGYDNNMSLIPSLDNAINSDEYKLTIDDEEKYNMLSVILSEKRESAIDIMLRTDERLKILSSDGLQN